VTKLNTAEMMRQKFVLELNGALAMENAGKDCKLEFQKQLYQKQNRKCNII